MESTQFGRYQLLKLLGKGGMGEVWRAHDTETDRVVAVKVLPPHLAHDETFQQRFRREAHLAARVNDPHIVPIHNFGEIEGRLFVDMRLIEGDDLGSLLSRGPLEASKAVNVIEQIGVALTAAHRIGLVHRDIKPSNILVGEYDFAYLIDFGIAQLAGDTAITSTGMAVGTMAYMAPERFMKGQIDSRSDIYALACVLHECLTGEKPYPGNSHEQLLAGHLMAPPPRPSLIRANVPAAFNDVVAKGMAKAPDDRYSSALELAQAVRHALGDTVQGATTPRHAMLPATDALGVNGEPAQGDQTLPASTYKISSPPTQQHPSDPPRVQQAASISQSMDSRQAPPIPRRSGTVTAAIIAAVAIVVLGIVLGVVVVLSTLKSPSPGNTSRGGPNDTSLSTTPPTSTEVSSSPPTSAHASGPNQTIADYIKQNGIQETMISHSTPGAPTIDLPVPNGWKVLPESTDAPYGGIVFNTPADPNDPPKIIAIVEKLTGNVDTDKLLAVAPGEVKNLQGYDGNDGEKSTLSGFPAYQIGGDYTKDGTQRVIAQKTVVIQGKDGLYVLQLNAEGPQPEKTPLMNATIEIDDKTTIAP